MVGHDYDYHLIFIGWTYAYITGLTNISSSDWPHTRKPPVLTLSERVSSFLNSDTALPENGSDYIITFNCRKPYDHTCIHNDLHIALAILSFVKINYDNLTIGLLILTFAHMLFTPKLQQIF